MTFETALITGGNGNLGRLVASRLEGNGVNVISFDLPGTESSETDARHAIVLGDMRDHDLLRRVFKDHKPQAVFHLASMLSGSSEADPVAAWDVNATASIVLMRLAIEFGVGPFFFASTVATYGPDLPDPLPENAEQWPENIYGATKVAVERMGFYLKRKQGLDFRCLRFPFVLSPYAPAAALTAFASNAFKAAAKGEPFTFPIAPDTGMSALFLDDVTRSIVEITNADAERFTQPVYNLHGYTVHARNIVEKLRQRYQKFECTYAPEDRLESLIGSWPTALVCDAAVQDWDWAVEYDFDKTAEAMFKLFETS
jgi:threonine 3-dehydrogenase